MKDIKKQLKNLKGVIELDQKTSEEMRAILMSKIENDIILNGITPKKNPISLITILTPSVRVMIVSLIVVLVPGGGFTTVRAAMGSLPGDLLYPVKITTEKIQVAFASDQGAKTQLRVEFAERRLKEAEHIINNEIDNKEEKIALAVEKFKQEVKDITENLKSFEDNSQKIIVEDKLVLLSGEVEKIVQGIEQANNLNATSIEVIAPNIDITLINQEKNPASTTIMMVDTPRIVRPAEPIDAPESFKIQLQIIKE